MLCRNYANHYPHTDKNPYPNQRSHLYPNRYIDCDRAWLFPSQECVETPSFHKSVIPMGTFLEDAEFSAGSIDYVTCVSTLEHVPFDGTVKLLNAAANLLKVGGQLVATVDLFIDLKPFTRRTSNVWGTNLDLGKLFATEERFKLVTGDPTQLYGCAGFDAKKIQERCSEFYLGEYPCMAQCFVLEKISD